MKLKQLILALFTILLLAACQEEKNEISFMVFGDPAEIAAYQSLVDAFQANHSQIQVTLRPIADQADYRRQLATEYAAGAPPDVFLLDFRRFPAFASSGGLEAVESYLADSDLIQESDFAQSALEAFQWAGQLVCLPQNVSSLVIYYNQDLFDAAGVGYPSAGWRWADFLAAAQALTKDNDGDGQIDQYGAGITPNLVRMAPFVWQNGGQLVDDPANPTRLTMDAPATLEAFQWFVNLQVSEHVVPDAVAEEVRDSESRFLDGTLAMYFNSRRGVPNYRTINTFVWDVGPIPVGVNTVGMLHSDAFCIAAKTEAKEDAWAFVEFANSVAGQTLLTSSGRTVPSLLSVAASETFLSPSQPPANSQLFLDNIPTLGRVPISTQWPAIEEILTQEIERAFYGQVSVAEAAATANEMAQPYFDK